MFGRGKSKPPNDSAASAPPVLISPLQELVGGDEELYRTLSRLMFLDPKKITSPLETVLRDAQEYESKGNSLRAEVSYRVAGGVSLYRGDVEGVRKYFSKASSLAGESRPEYKILANRAADAVSVAKKFYESMQPL